VHILIAAPVKYVSSIYEAMLFLSFFLSFLFSRAGVLCGFRKALLLLFFFLFLIGRCIFSSSFCFFFWGGDLFALSSLFFFIFSQIFDLGTCRLLSKNQGIVEILLDPPPLVVFVVFVLIKSARAFGYITIPRKCQHLLPWYRRSFLPPSSR